MAARLQDETLAARVDDVMGYWDEAQLPFYSSLARTFPVADRWFGSCLGPTFPNRRFLVAGTAHGLATDDVSKCFDRPTNGTIFDLLTDHGIDWANYHGTSPARLVVSRLLGRTGRRVITKIAPTARRRPGAVLDELESKLQFTADVYAVNALDHVRHVHGMKRFFRDASAGTLPAFGIVDPSFVDYSEETAPGHPPRRAVRSHRDRRRHARTGMAVDLARVVLRRTRRLLRPRPAAAGRRTRRRRARTPTAPATATTATASGSPPSSRPRTPGPAR